jgi:hypothetical protein
MKAFGIVFLPRIVALILGLCFLKHAGEPLLKMVLFMILFGACFWGLGPKDTGSYWQNH